MSVFINGKLVGAGAGGGVGNQAILVDQKASGTEGGTFTLGAQRQRTLTTIIVDNISGLTLVANQFTLPAGTYRIFVHAPGYRVNGHKARLWNDSDSILVREGTSARSENLGDDSSVSIIDYELVIASTKTFEIQHYSTATQATSGFGAATSTGDLEVYTVVVLNKIA